MEGSSDVHYAENKVLLEKKHKRHFKTPSQLQALEDFYTEHKYPTESMKAELGEKIGLTERQVSGWFCHRRLKDKKKEEEILVPGNKDLSSDVIQDRGSGLKQDSCSSTRQEEFKVADIKEVESQRFCHETMVLNYEPKRPYDGDGMDDTSSESNNALRESFCPQNRSPLDVEIPKYQAPSEFVPKYRGRVGPSGYLKIKGQTENAAITAVKRQLGRHYREDGPSLGIEFDPLPPGAFESPNNNANNDSYRDLEPITSSFVDSSGIHKRPGFNKIDLGTYGKATEYRSLHRSDQDNFSYGKPKHPFPHQSTSFPYQKPVSGVDSYPTRGTTDYGDRINHNIPYQRDSLGISAETFSDKPLRAYSGKSAIGPEEPWRPSYDNANLKVARKRERFDSRPVASDVWHQDHTNYVDDKTTSTKILKDEALYMDRRPMSDNHNSSRLKKCPTEDLRAGNRGREEFLQEYYKFRTSSRELSQWSRQTKGPTMEMPSSFSEDEAAETCSSVD